MIRVTVFCEMLQEWGAGALDRWAEFRPRQEAERAELAARLDRDSAEIHRVYPAGLLDALAQIFEAGDGFTVRRATPDQAEYGLDGATLSETDVLVWWSHIANDLIPDDAAFRVARHVQGGMGFIALHSAHQCKPLRYLLGTSLSMR